MSISKLVRTCYLLIVFAGLAWLTACERRNALTASSQGNVEIEGDDTASVFSSPVAGDPDKIKVVHIFRREPSRSAGTIGDSCSVAVKDFKLEKTKWSSGASYFVKSANSSGLSEADVVNAFSSAFGPWNTAEPLSPVFTYSGSVLPSTSSSYGLNVDGVNTVSFGDTSPYGAGVIAVTQYVFSRFTGRTLEFDQLYNDTLSWTTATSPTETCMSGTTGSFDLLDIATHEDGHIFGLSDLYNGRDKGLTMYGYASPGETLKRTLAKGDVLGITQIY